MGHTWDPDAADAAVLSLMEEDLQREEDRPDMAKRILKDTLPLAALRLAQLVQGSDDRMAFQASKYLIDRGLGSIVPGGDYATKEVDLFQDLLEKCTSEYGIEPGSGQGSAG